MLVRVWADPWIYRASHCYPFKKEFKFFLLLLETLDGPQLFKKNIHPPHHNLSAPFNLFLPTFWPLLWSSFPTFCCSDSGFPAVIESRKLFPTSGHLHLLLAAWTAFCWNSHPSVAHSLTSLILGSKVTASERSHLYPHYSLRCINFLLPIWKDIIHWLGFFSRM